MEEKLSKKMTSDEFLALEDTEERYELIGGEIYAMSPAPNEIHQTISVGLSAEILANIRKNGGKCKVLTAPFDVKLSDEDTVQPDIFVVCDRSKFDGKICRGAPDWVIEIVSPNNPRRDYSDKLALYASSGVREYWIIDPESERVLVYPLEESRATGIYTFDDDIAVGIYKNSGFPLSICIRRVLQ